MIEVGCRSWSNGAVSRSAVETRMGSNPIPTIQCMTTTRIGFQLLHHETQTSIVCL
jgi:hypothetical protein